MIRETGRKGDILHLAIPVKSSGLWTKLQAEIKVDILIESVTIGGQVTVVIEEPHIVIQ
jgi:hypothetical protein